MHSRIFCLVSKNETEEEKEKIRENFKDLTEDDLYEQFQCKGFDYCNEDTDLRDDWEWLGQNKMCETYEEDGKFFVRFNKDRIKEYVEDKLERLKAKVDELSMETFNEWVIYDIQNIMNDEHSFWFLIDEQYNDYSFDSFMLSRCRAMHEGNDDFQLDFEVVKSVDYHF